MSETCTTLQTFYSTPIINDNIDGNGTDCGFTHLGYRRCGTAHQAGCCPPGFKPVGETTLGVAPCTSGRLYVCQPEEPIMFGLRKAECCSNIGLPQTNNQYINGAQGYCGSQWCPDSTSCRTFMRDYCQGGNLTTPYCKTYCKEHPGVCDNALIDYCKQYTRQDLLNDPNLRFCGCSLPVEQYPARQLARRINGTAIPTACDQLCDDNDAIKLGNQPNACTVNSICLIDNVDINIVDSVILGDVFIDQECGVDDPTRESLTQPSLFEQFSTFIGNASLESKLFGALLLTGLLAIFVVLVKK